MKKFYYINTKTSLYECYLNSIIYNRTDSDIIIALAHENRKIGIPYFKVYNGKRFTDSTKVMRVCFKSPEILTNYIENTAEQWDLDDFKKNILKVIKNLNLPENYALELRKIWDILKFKWNEYIINLDLSCEDYFSGKYDKIYADNLDYLPSNLKMPNYLNLKEMNCFEEDEYSDKVIKSSKPSRISILIDLNDDYFMDEPYFKVYKNDLKTNSLKTWTFDFFGVNLFGTSNEESTKNPIPINKTISNNISKYLKSKSLRFDDNIWKELKFKWNVQKGFMKEDNYIDYKNGKYDKLYRDHLLYIPYKLPMPNYRNLWKKN